MTWAIAAAGAGVAAVSATLLSMAPANASATTVNAQMSLTGVATQSNVLGGSEIGVHPGDTVTFKASALPTAGLENIPSLGPVLEDLVNTLLGSQFQVVASFPSSFPGGAQTVTLGGPTSGVCKGVASKSVTFPNAGAFGWTWKVQYVVPTILGCSRSGVSSTDLNLLSSAGVKLNASNSWMGQIVVADNPPSGGISIQLPGVSVAPSITGVGQLPTVGVPGATLPTVKVSVPKVPGLPGGGSTQTPAPGGTSSAGGGILPVPARVVPRGEGDAIFGNAGSGGFDPGTLSGAAAQIDNLTPVLSVASKSDALAQQNSTGKHKTIDLAAGRAASSQIPVILAVLAMIALVLVAGTYARLFLLRRPTPSDPA